MAKTTFKAPQKPLRSSWKEIAFKMPSKKNAIITKSLTGRGATLLKSKGQYVWGGNQQNSNLY